jgi:DNA-binding CsgD family transcriptional regulator
MDHVRIVFYILHLMVGAAAVVVVFLRSRTSSHVFLTPFLHFICFSNLLISISLATEYTCVNILGNCLVYHASVYQDIFAPTGSLLYLGMVFSLAHTVMSLQGQSFSSRWRAAGWVGITLVAASQAVRGLVTDGGLVSRSLIALHSGLYLVATFAIFAFLISLILYARRCSGRPEKRMAGSFGWFYTFAFLILVVSAISQSRFDVLVSAVTLLLFNLFPVLWVQSTVKPILSFEGMDGDGGFRLDSVLKPYQVSKREQQITELILRGKSNKEIEEALFISLHTVKNHIYNLYQKLGVKSRGQLVNFILESQKEQRDLST